MARLESVAVGGYYPTPVSVLPLIVAALDMPPTFEILDPCAGDGEAALTVARSPVGSAKLYAIELEKTRHEKLERESRSVLGWGRAETVHSDAFQVSFKGDGVGLLYLNPPYDTDPEVGRLEEKFLARFTAALCEGGVLVFLVPFYALAASARTLATNYENVRCYRFPDAEFAGYKQVALFARKRATPLWQPDPAVLARVEGWAADATSMLSLEDATADHSVPSCGSFAHGLSLEAMRVDMVGLLAAVEPWTMTDRAGKRTRIPGIVPEGALDDLLIRRYPVAMPPRPAHIAAGIAAGVFNGARIEPDDERSPLPALLVKGVFDKEFRTVEEKKDKEGNTKAIVQVQQPKLVTTVLDLSTSEYVTIRPSGERTAAETVAGMTMADLLAIYGKGLMETMLRQCPVLHDPGRDGEDTELAPLTRPLFTAQTHATTAAVKLLGGLDCKRRRGKSAFILGEIGSGKTSVALATALSIGARRSLVMCPPHLLTSWQNQIKMVCPNVRAVVLSDVGDVQALASDPDPTPTVAILSRETAKLGHAYAAVSRCGACGDVPPPGDHAKKRSTCEAQRIVVKDPLGRLVRELAIDLLHVFPHDLNARQVVPPKVAEASVRWVEHARDDAYEGWAWGRLTSRGVYDRILAELVSRATSDREDALTWLAPLEDLVWADPNPAVVLEIARALYAHGAKSASGEVAKTARTLLLALPDVDVAEFRAMDVERPSYYGDPRCRRYERTRAHIYGNADAPWNATVRRTEDGVFDKKGKALGRREVALVALAALSHATLRYGRVCGAPLYQAIPEPRRYPLATYIAKRHASLFDLLILDEGHEYATDGSAQEQAAHRLTGLGIPTLLLTGTIMNGYATSLFTNMWALSSDFRREFQRDEQTRFVDRYGYRKRIVEDRDKESGKVVEYGSMSDRIERRERMIGDAPGILPVFLLRYLLPLAVTLHKTDLAIDIPPCTETTAAVVPTSKLAENYETLKATLMQRIKADRFDPERAGKLWGAMAELPSYLDVATADVCNTDEGRYEIAYPENVDGPRLVASVEAFPANTILPKEEWLLRHLDEAFGKGRNVLVFGWHTRLLPRLARLITKHTGEKCPILVPEKVPTKKREDWITSAVVNTGARVLVCNPLTVQTGLNNLVYFADEVFMENPACNPQVYRQTVGRVDRIGQEKPTRIVFPLYSGTSQVALHSLLLQKVGVSMQTDGLDGDSAMQAAGIGEDGFSTFSVGRQLYELLAGSAKGPRKKRAA